MNEQNISRSWYLIHTKPNQEQTAKENLERQGYETYLPLTSLLKRHRGKSVRKIGPLFPRYIFIYLSDEIDNWGPIRSTLGVAALVRFGMEPAKVPDILVQNLKSQEVEPDIHPMKILEFEEGDKVRIAEGPFEGYEAIFSAKDSNDRVLILLKIAENYAKLKIEAQSIERLD